MAVKDFVAFIVAAAMLLGPLAMAARIGWHSVI